MTDTRTLRSTTRHDQQLHVVRADEPIPPRTRLRRLLRSNRWMLAAVILIGAALRLWGLDEESYWFDEAYTWTTSTQLELNEAVTFDPFYPPLYPFIMWFWYSLDGSEFWGRLFSVIFSVGVLWITYMIGKQISSARLGLIAAGLLALNPIQIQYAQEARAYALLNFLVAIVLWCVIYVALNRSHRLVVSAVYVVSMGLTLLLNNIGPIVFGVANLAMLLIVVRRRDVRLAGMWIVVQVVALLPWLFIWLPSFLRQYENMTNAYWMPEVTPLYLWNVIARDMFAAHLPYHAFGILVVIVLGLTLLGLMSVRAFPGGKESSLILAIFIAAGPAATALFSLAVNDVLATRQQSWVTISIALALAALISRGLSHTHPFDRIAFTFVGGFVALIMLTGSIAYLSSQNKENWREVAEVVDVRPGDVVVYTAAHTQMPFAYYEDQLPPPVATAGGDAGPHRIDTWAWRVRENGIAEVRMPYVEEREAGELESYRLEQAIDGVDARRVWVIDSRWDSDQALTSATEELLRDRGDVSETFTWPGNSWASPGVSPVTVTLYEL